MLTIETSEFVSYLSNMLAELGNTPDKIESVVPLITTSRFNGAYLGFRLQFVGTENETLATTRVIQTDPYSDDARHAIETSASYAMWLTL